MMRRFLVLPVKAFWRKFAKPPRPDHPMDVIVASFGGSASTAFIEHLSRFTRCNDARDADGLKHAKAPPQWLLRDKSVKVLFLTRDLEAASFSIARRGFLYEQLAKHGCASGLFMNQAEARQILKQHMHRQLQNWAKPLGKRLLVVDYSNFKRDEAKIATFLNLNTSFPVK